MNLDRCGPGLKTGLHQKTRDETITVYVYTRFALHARDNTPSPRLCTKKSTRLLRELRRISLHVPPSKGNTDWVGSVVLVSHRTYFLLKKSTKLLLIFLPSDTFKPKNKRMNWTSYKQTSDLHSSSSPASSLIHWNLNTSSLQTEYAGPFV